MKTHDAALSDAALPDVHAPLVVVIDAAGLPQGTLVSQELLDKIRLLGPSVNVFFATSVMGDGRSLTEGLQVVGVHGHQLPAGGPNHAVEHDPAATETVVKSYLSQLRLTAVPTGPARSPASAAAAAAASETAWNHWADQVSSHLQEALASRLRSQPDLAEQNPIEVADRLVASLPRRHEFDQLGPFYDTAGLSKWWGVSRQALMARVKSGSLLGCQTQDGDWVYPVWQMFDDGQLVPHMADVVKILRRSAKSPWTVATWLRTPVDDELHGLDAATWLRDGRDPEPVIAEANRDAAAWAQ